MEKKHVELYTLVVGPFKEPLKRHDSYVNDAVCECIRHGEVSVMGVHVSPDQLPVEGEFRQNMTGRAFLSCGCIEPITFSVR